MKGKKLLGLAVLIALLGSTLAGCGDSRLGGDLVVVNIAQAAVPRDTDPAVPQADLTELAAGNTAFAFDLYQALREKEGNLFYSPFSISLALAMTYAGASGQTEEQMAEVLHYTLPQERLHPAFDVLDLQLISRGAGAEGQDDKGFRLKVANSVWGQSGYQFLSQYLEVLAKNYGAGLRLLDFQKSPEPSRAMINDWVDDQTEGKIKNLLPQGSIHDWTRLVLVNAVYFNAAWLYPFMSENTRDHQFTLLDGRKVDVPMMSQTKHLSYAKENSYQAVELPYDGGELSLVLLLPDAGSFKQFESNLGAGVVSDVLKALQPADVSLTLPKFSYSSDFSLGETLSGLGMPDAMDAQNADFSGMDGKRDLYIGGVVHKAFVAVDEKGTEAAAATGVIVGTTAMPKLDVTLTVDRPFIFLIRDIQTGTVLFVGRVLNPGQ